VGKEYCDTSRLLIVYQLWNNSPRKLSPTLSLTRLRIIDIKFPFVVPYFNRVCLSRVTFVDRVCLYLTDNRTMVFARVCDAYSA
jgi:hypothetical protein